MKKRPIKGYEGIYWIDRNGSVFSKERQLSPHVNKNGYVYIGLSKNGIKTQWRLHRLVAINFIPNPDNKETVNHKDGDKTNNKVSNLEWATQQEQSDHAIRVGLRNHRGQNNPSSKISDDELEYAFLAAINGEYIKDIAYRIGVDRNTITKGFARIGKREEWVRYLSSRGPHFAACLG